MTKIYIAGPMSGIPQFNYPAFIAAAKRLREEGFEVYCPAEMDDEKTAEEAMASEDGSLRDGDWGGDTWGDFLSRDVKLIADECDEVCLLPGWGNSRGARLEAFVALQLQKPVSVLKDTVMMYYPSDWLMGRIAHWTIDQGDVSRYGG